MIKLEDLSPDFIEQAKAKRKYDSRLSGTMFSEICKFINLSGVGEIYTCKELREASDSVSSYRLGCVHIHLLRTNVVERVKHGTYKILAEIPYFVTENMLMVARGYTTETSRYINDCGNYDWKQVPRGLPWSAGLPNPYEVEAEEKVTIDDVKTSLHNFPKGIIKAIYVIGAQEYLVKIVNYSIVSGTDVPHVYIEFEQNNDCKIVLFSDLLDVVILKDTETLIKESTVAEKNNLLKARIVDILKQGLSAEDAATEILKLK